MEKIMVKTKAEYDKFVRELSGYSKNESVNYLERHKAVINTNRKIICLSMQMMRTLAKQILAGEPDEFLKVASPVSYEEVMIYGLVIAGMKDINQQLEWLEKYIGLIDSWALCDSVISTFKTLSKKVNKDKCFEYFCNLCFSSEEYVARYGLVTLMSYYLEDEYIDKILEICVKVNNDEYYVQMAIAWLLSFAFVSHREKTLNLLNKKCLSKFIQNKTIQKCRESFRVSQEDKELLVSLKI